MRPSSTRGRGATARTWASCLWTKWAKRQIARSNNGIVRSKYITFGVPADGLETARPRLERVSSDIIVDIVRGMSVSLDELPALLRQLRDGSGHGVQKPGERKEET